MDYPDLYERLCARLDARRAALETTRSLFKRHDLYQEIKRLVPDVVKLRTMVSSDPDEDEAKFQMLQCKLWYPVDEECPF